MIQMNKEIKEYFSHYDDDIRKRLSTIREIAFDLLPDADEAIKYRMPTIIYHGNLLHYAAFKNHIGIYPLPHVLEELKDELVTYTQGKGSIQFKNNEPLPIAIIKKIIKTRILEREEEEKAKLSKKKQATNTSLKPS